MDNTLRIIFLCLFMHKVIGLSPPKVKPFSFNPEVLEGHREQVFCSVFKGDPPLIFTWYKDGDLLNPSGHVTIQDLNEFTSALTIAKISSEDIGNYTCNVGNGVGRDTYTAKLIVKASPMLVKDLNDISSTEGSIIGIDCVVRGYPKPTITWSRENENGHRLDLSSNSIRPGVFPNGTLHFSGLHHSDAGRYTCHASNGVGNSIKKTFTLSVHSSPKVTNITSKTTVSNGHVATIECQGVGDQPVEIIWFKGANQIRESDRYEIRDRANVDGVASELVVISVTRNEGGVYKCVVRNKFGEDERKTILRVVETPESPKDVKIIDTWSRSAYMIWSSSYDGGSPIAKYIIQFWKDIDGVPHRLLELTVLPSTSSLLLKDLDPGFQYAVRVIAESDIGRGHPSATVTFQTEEEAPTGAPTDVAVGGKGSNAITIGWKAPPREHWNGVIKGYYAGIKVHGISERYAFFTVTNSIADSSIIRYKFINLKKATRYSIVIKAFNSAGTGPNSHELQAETRDSGLPRPQQFYVADCTTNSITFKWKKLDATALESISSVIVHLRSLGSESWSEFKVTTELEGFTVSELEPGTRYQAYLTAHGEGEISSDPTEVLTVITDGHIDHLPRSGSSQSAFVEETLPKLVRMEVLIPVLVCIVVIATVVVMACAYVARSKARYIAMADAQYIGSYDTARLSQSYPPLSSMTATMQNIHPPSDDTSYDVPWDVPTVRT